MVFHPLDLIEQSGKHKAMLKPHELNLCLPIDLSEGQTTTDKVWEMLVASYEGDLFRLKALIDENPALAYCQFNYTPPIHFAVREGHTEIVRYLLDLGAYDPEHRTYPFLDSLLTVAEDRGFTDIVKLLNTYDPGLFRFKKAPEPVIHYQRTDREKAFERAVDQLDLDVVKAILADSPELVHDPTFFWGEGILSMPAKDPSRPMMQLLTDHGATVPDVSKWGQFYYFKHFESAKFLLENGMNPNHMTWHHVTLLHDMAQNGFTDKAALLIEHGAELNSIEEEYQSTPLGLAARWGQLEMVKFLIEKGADPVKSGAEWSTPLAWATRKNHGEIAEILRNFFK